MTIPTQMSLVGFVGSAPELHFTKDGAECCRLRVGVAPAQQPPSTAIGF